jgi:prepilin-type N-terminal cleavage/methylation domain-containing protein
LKVFDSKSHFNNQDGFTLIEILIAITLMSVLMVGVYTITNSSTEIKEKIISEDRDYLQVVTAFARLERDFSEIFSPLYYSHRYQPTEEERRQVEEFRAPQNRFEPNEKYIALTNDGQPIPNIDNPDKSTLIFKANVHKRTMQNVKQSRYAWIRYRLVPMEASKNDDSEQNRSGLYQLMRGYQSENIYETEFEWDKVPEFVILKNIKSLEFHFWNKNAAKFVSSLKELNQNDPLLRLVQVKLVWVDQAGVEKEFEKSFRTLMPYFDTKADKDALARAKNSDGEGGIFGGGGGASDQGAPTDEGPEDE